MQTNHITIAPADPSQAEIIAELIMKAMTDECCQYFAGENHTLLDFKTMMISLVQHPLSQYSYTNTLVALDGDKVVGCCVSYDGSLLHTLRNTFIIAAKKAFGINYSDMDDETQAGECYADSLAVLDEYQGRGIASQLLQATYLKAKQMNLPLGLLVDKGNPRAEKLYLRLGFTYQNDAIWGSHPMKHLQKEID